MCFTCPECNEDAVVYKNANSNRCKACGVTVPNSAFCIRE